MRITTSDMSFITTVTTPTKTSVSARTVGLLLGVAALVLAAAFVGSYTALPSALAISYQQAISSSTALVTPAIPPLDTLLYDTKLLSLAHVATTSPWYTAFLSGTTTIALPGTTTTLIVKTKPWPTRAPYPADSRALLPFNRIVAYYGNFLSKGMGVLGQYPPDVMVQKLQAAAGSWRVADPNTPVIPAIDYIAVVAQGSAGRDGKYRARMSDEQLQKAVDLAQTVHGIVVLDVQVGLSTVQTEVPLLEQYLKLPNVHLAIDPEFAMHGGTPPGRVIGSLDADDVNFTAQYLANLVRTYNLPPKILVVHRFTREMVTHVSKIQPLPEVQLVMDMDGWGGQAKKIGTFTAVVNSEPLQFAGFKLFYKNDILGSTTMLGPKQVLDLTPAPVFIQYQ